MAAGGGDVLPHVSVQRLQRQRVLLRVRIGAGAASQVQSGPRWVPLVWRAYCH